MKLPLRLLKKINFTAVKKITILIGATILLPGGLLIPIIFIGKQFLGKKEKEEN
jgi:hypothetical protein